MGAKGHLLNTLLELLCEQERNSYCVKWLICLLQQHLKWKWKLCPTLCHGLPSVHSMEFSRPEYWSGCHFPFPGDFSDPGIKPRSPALQVDSLPAEPQGKPKNTGVGSLSLLQGVFPTQERTGVSWIAGRFFTIWTIREALQHLLYHTKAWTQTTSKAIRYRVCIAWHGIPKRDSSPELKLDIGKGSSSEVLKMNLEGQCETVRKGIEGCRGESICKVMKLWGNGLHLGKS